jgi:hypothetical protein
MGGRRDPAGGRGLDLARARAPELPGPHATHAVRLDAAAGAGQPALPPAGHRGRGRQDDGRRHEAHLQRADPGGAVPDDRLPARTAARRGARPAPLGGPAVRRLRRRPARRDGRHRPVAAQPHPRGPVPAGRARPRLLQRRQHLSPGGLRGLRRARRAPDPALRRRGAGGPGDDRGRPRGTGAQLRGTVGVGRRRRAPTGRGGL